VWVYGAIHKRTPYGICGRIEPNGKDGNGRFSGLMMSSPISPSVAFFL
jgi:hypothetical protein